MRTFFWICLTAMVAIYATMLLWSLPHLSALADGQLMFDLRPGGYSNEEAFALLEALRKEGADFYLDVQQRLDTAYPALLAIVLTMALHRVFPKVWAVGFSIAAIAGACFDYLENAAVAVMLRAGTKMLDAEVVAAASRWTLLKSAADSIAITALLVGLLWAGWRRFRKV